MTTNSENKNLSAIWEKHARVGEEPEDKNLSGFFGKISDDNLIPQEFVGNDSNEGSDEFDSPGYFPSLFSYSSNEQENALENKEFQTESRKLAAAILRSSLIDMSTVNRQYKDNVEDLSELIVSPFLKKEDQKRFTYLFRQIETPKKAK